MADEPAFLGTEFDIFAHKAKQASTDSTLETIYKPIASVDQTDIEFVIPGESDSYVDLDIKLFIRGKLVKSDGSDLAETHYIACINNLLHSTFSQCTITLNGTQITQNYESYPYRALVETLLTYGNDAAASHLQMGFWTLDSGNMIGGDCTKPAETTNTGFISRWKQINKSQEIQMYGRIHSDICNVPSFLVSGVTMQIRFTKSRDAFYIMSNKEDSKATFKILEALLYVKKIRPTPSVLASHNEVLLKGYPVRYNFTRVELKSFTFASGSQSLSIDNAVFGVLPKRLLFTMVKNTDYLGTANTNPFNFKHYDLNHFALYVNGRQISSEGLSLNMNNEKTAVMGYRTLFEGSGIHHSNAGLQITPTSI